MMDRIADAVVNVYFIGIGGIGMSALARYFKSEGFQVSGYDRTPSPLTARLQQEGIGVNYTDEEDEIGEAFRNKAHTLVVYTPAIPKDNSQLNYFIRNGFDLHKRSEVLGLLSKRGKALCVAGTHGKTTVSTLLAYLLKESAVGCNAFLGGISVNYDTNLLLDKHSEYIVIEADEFDRSFLHLEPEMAVITSMDADHLDIYGTHEELIAAFGQFAENVRGDGKLFLKKGLRLTGHAVDGYYSVDEEADDWADNLRMEEGYYVFDYHGRKTNIIGLRSGFPGRVNVENATAAITLALEAGVTPEEIRLSLPEFRGVVRRFNVHTRGQVIYIDDYAHHPREIEAVLTSVREMWPDKKIRVAFQPHLYSRTHDFYEWFARSLNLADEVFLLDIYPARELPIPGVTSEIILEKLAVPARIVSKTDLPHCVEQEVKDGVFMTLGAGDIDRLVPEFIRLFGE